MNRPGRRTARCEGTGATDRHVPDAQELCATVVNSNSPDRPIGIDRPLRGAPGLVRVPDPGHPSPRLDVSSPHPNGRGTHHGFAPNNHAPRRQHARAPVTSPPGSHRWRSSSPPSPSWLRPCSADAAQTPVGLGTAGSFAILAGAGITNTNATTVNGDIGTFPTTSESGTASMTITGTNHAGDAVTQGAKNDLVTGYNTAAGESPPDCGPRRPRRTDPQPRAPTTRRRRWGSPDRSRSTAAGTPTRMFVFQAGSTLTTASASSVNLINGAQACNVFWQVGSSATLGTGSTFRGTILALTSITVTSATTINGRVLARNGAVTLDNDTITSPTCTTSAGTDGHGPPAAARPTPTPRHRVRPGRRHARGQDRDTDRHHRHRHPSLHRDQPPVADPRGDLGHLRPRVAGTFERTPPAHERLISRSSRAAVGSRASAGSGRHGLAPGVDVEGRAAGEHGEELGVAHPRLGGCR